VRPDTDDTLPHLGVVGEIELTFRGVGAVAMAGQTINVPANAPHVFRNVSERPARLLCLCSSPT
jgi:mannose-6-phosphate isomerase-like protein (cupin superfamily)